MAPKTLKIPGTFTYSKAPKPRTVSVPIEVREVAPAVKGVIKMSASQTEQYFQGLMRQASAALKLVAKNQEKRAARAKAGTTK